MSSSQPLSARAHFHGWFALLCAASRCFALLRAALRCFACLIRVCGGLVCHRSVYRLGLSGHGPVECRVITGLDPWRRALRPEKVLEIESEQRSMGKWNTAYPPIIIGIAQGHPGLHLLGGSHAAIASEKSGIPTAMYDFQHFTSMLELSTKHARWMVSARMLIFIPEYSLL